MDLRARVVEAFRERCGHEPRWIVRAPGRVNLIGEHTDYNDGFVLPLAIDRAVWIALEPLGEARVIVHSLDFNETGEFGLQQFGQKHTGWIEYLKGVAWALSEAGVALEGWQGVMTSDVPIGAGLSSSAALELATARAFCAVGGCDWDPGRMARLAQRAENQWVGVNCGIMDQLISAAGVEGHALLIDCRSLETQPVPLPAGTSVVVLDTATRRGLEGSAYNERREQCERAAEYFGVKALRDVTLEEFNARAAELPELTRRRARHVVSENARTLEAGDVMKAGDAERLGVLMYASHESLRDDFEVSSDALNEIVEIARVQPGCYGARMTGAGFGGCAVALVRAEAAEAFANAVQHDYHARTGVQAQVYITLATRGAAVVG